MLQDEFNSRYPSLSSSNKAKADEEISQMSINLIKDVFDDDDLQKYTNQGSILKLREAYMSKFKVVLVFSDGEQEECDEIFDSYEEAWSYGEYECSCYHVGCETLFMSNPGDDPLDENPDIDFEVEEIED